MWGQKPLSYRIRFLLFFNEPEWKRFQELKAAEGKNNSARLCDNEVQLTSAVVALDQAGNLAAETSTGGPNRVGRTGHAHKTCF